MVIKIENGIIRLMLKRGSVISPNSRFTVPYWTQTRKRAEVTERVIIYNGKGKFDFSQSSRGTNVSGSFTTYYYNTSNPDYDVVELPIIVKEKGYISIHKLSGGILVPLESGGGMLVQKLYLTDTGLIPWDADADKIPVPEIINKRHREKCESSLKKENICETPSEYRKNGSVILRQLKFAEEDYSPKEQEFAYYLESVRAFKRAYVNFNRRVIHFVLQKNPDDELLQYLDADVFLSKELDGYVKLRKESQCRYRRCFKYWGEFCTGRKSRFEENKDIMTKYADFVKYQQDKHYSMETILKTCQIVDKIKTKNEFEDEDILKTDSDKLCETITGRRYIQGSDRFLNNIIRKYQAYLQECEA